MKRFDPIAVIALILALIALLLVLQRPTGPQPQPTVPGFAWVSQGLLSLEARDGGCRLRLEFPSRLHVRPGDRIEWDLYNRCEGPISLNAGPREKVEGNQSKADDPFDTISETTIQPGAKARILASIKDEGDLTDPSGENPSDRWRFRWTVNGEAQEDPEIEVEYRRRR
jgi:hypothetical protein